MVTVDFTAAQVNESGGGTGAFFTARLQLSTGEVVGEGFGPSEKTAIDFAILDAQASERGRDLGNFEARIRGRKVA